MDKIMPSLGLIQFSSLEPTHVLAWVDELVAAESPVHAKITAYTLLELLEAATANGHLSKCHIDDYRLLLESSAVAMRWACHRKIES